jgi:hypothetical protein
MFNHTDYFQKQEDEATTRFGGLGDVGRNVGKWLGFAAIVSTLAFSGYHGINATMQYRADNIIGMITGIVGIITVEIIIFSLILRWHNRGITGDLQRVAAIITMVIGFILIFLAVVTDSQLNAGMALTPELHFYLIWLLPAAPLILGACNHIVDELAPDQRWSQKAAEAMRELHEMRFQAHIAEQKAELQAQKAIINANLNARASAANQIAAHYQSDDVQSAIRQSALGNVPALLRAIGVDPATIPDANANGQFDLDDVAAYLEEHPDQAARLFGLAREQDGSENAQENQPQHPQQSAAPETNGYPDGNQEAAPPYPFSPNGHSHNGQ